MSERHLPDDQSSTIDPYLITSVRQTLAEQSAALQNLSKQLDSGQYQRVLNLIMNCKGHVILSGMGKSGHVGRKISATLASTGTPSFFIHPAEAFHGDLGMITPYDLLILISASGETDEILKLVPSLKNFGNRIIAIPIMEIPRWRKMLMPCWNSTWRMKPARIILHQQRLPR